MGSPLSAVLLSMINNPAASFKQFLPLFFSPVPGIPCGSLTFRTRYLPDALIYKSAPAVYSFPHPVSSGNIPGIPDVLAFRWAIPAPSESLENKIWPVTACFPVSGTYPCLFLLMKNLPGLSRRILPAYWHLGIAQCSRFPTGRLLL